MTTSTARTRTGLVKSTHRTMALLCALEMLCQRADAFQVARINPPALSLRSPLQSVKIQPQTGMSKAMLRSSLFASPSPYSSSPSNNERDNNDESNTQNPLNDAITDSQRRSLLQTPILAGLALATPSNALEDYEKQRIAIFEKVSPSVVFIDTFTERRDAFTTNILEVPLGSGSGFVWDKEGHIVTNYHVVRNAKSAQIAILSQNTPGLATTSSANPQSTSSSITEASTFTARRPSQLNDATRATFKASVVGVDPGKDIAVLKVDAPVDLLQPITLGTSQGLRVGQAALAIGNPFGLDHTLTAGVISGLGREVKSPIGRPITNVIQSDASINPGNSGGPLLDSSGRVIGMNTAIFSPSGASAGIGFAIPIDTVQFIVETLLRDGQVIRPVLGITFLESKQARALGITSGVLVLDVPAGSPAALAGMKGTRRTEAGLIEIGDIITKVNSQVINTESDLFQALEGLSVGDMVKVRVNRPVIVNEQLVVQEFNLEITLQANTAVEKAMQLYQYSSPR
jgi:S1-C subfamily serine protease